MARGMPRNIQHIELHTEGRHGIALDQCRRRLRNGFASRTPDARAGRFAQRVDAARVIRMVVRD